MADNVRALLDAEGARREGGAVGPQRARAAVARIFWAVSTWAASCTPTFGADSRLSSALPSIRAASRRWASSTATTGSRRTITSSGRRPTGFVDAALAATGSSAARARSRVACRPTDRLRQMDGEQAVAADDRRGVRARRTSMNMPWRPTRATISTSWCSSSARPRRAAAPKARRAWAAVGLGRGRNEEPTNLALAGGGHIPDGWRAIQRQPLPVSGRRPRTGHRLGGGRAVRLARADSDADLGATGRSRKASPAARWRGQRLVFSAAMRAEAPRIGTGAQLVVNVWPKRKEGARRAGRRNRSWRCSRMVRCGRPTGPAGRSPSTFPPTPSGCRSASWSPADGAGWFGDLELDAGDPARGSSTCRARAIGGSSRTSACQIRWPVPRFKTHRARWRFFSASGYKPGKARSWWRTPTVRVWTKATAVSIQMGK